MQYPLPGHSMMPIDRDFATIEKKRRQKEVIPRPEQYVAMIKSSQFTHPFQIRYLQYPLTIWSKALQPL